MTKTRKKKVAKITEAELAKAAESHESVRMLKQLTGAVRWFTERSVHVSVRQGRGSFTVSLSK